MIKTSRRALGMLAPKDVKDLAVKFVLFCLLIACWHAFIRRFGFADRATPLSEMLLEALIAGAPFVFVFLVGSLHQIRAIRALTDRAYYDMLSGVLNRQTFVNRLSRALPKARSGVLLFINADHFKDINDRYGHAMGDRCISAIGHRLNWHLRETDLAGRVGGEEFAVFIPDVSEQHARTVATRLGLPVSFSDQDAQLHLTVTLSIGATFVDGERSLEQLFNDADEALYSAKSSGRAQLQFHEMSDAIHLSEARMAGLAVNKSFDETKGSRSKIRLVSS